MKTRILIAEPSQVIVEGLKAILGKPTRFSLLSPVPNLDDIESQESSPSSPSRLCGMLSSCRSHRSPKTETVVCT